MPIYEFECSACGAFFEELVNGDTTPPCPNCHADKTSRLPSCACYKTVKPQKGTGSPYSPPSTYVAGKGGCGPCSGGNCSSCH